MKDLTHLGPLYHDYSIFGASSIQLPGNFSLNQKSKAPILSAYIQYAIAKSKRTTSSYVSFCEMFCADGYYTMLARHFGATSSTGIDNGRDDYFYKAESIRNILGLDNVSFIKMDSNDIDTLIPVDIIANIGGLYHVSNPMEILFKSYKMAIDYLIVQSVVSMANTDYNYYEQPAPGWDWGNRYNRYSFDSMICKMFRGKIVDSHFNELEGNDRLEDRGSVYYLIKV